MGSVFRILSFTTFISFLGFALSSTTTFAKQTCETFLQQYKPARPGSGQSFAIETPALNALPRLLVNFAGSETEITYRPDWKVSVDHEGLSFLDFTFFPVGFPEEFAGAAPGRIPSIQVYPPAENQPHLHELRVRVNRDKEGAFQDWNLLEKSLDYLAAFSTDEDRFVWTVNDRVLLSKLNDAFQDALREIAYIGSPPEMLDKEVSGLDIHRDLNWPEISADDLRELMERLDEEGIRKRLSEAVSNSLFGRSIDSGASWQMSIRPVPISYNEAYRLTFILELAPLF